MSISILSADITRDQITISLASSVQSGELLIELIALYTGGNHTREQMRGGTTIIRNFNIDRLAEGEYNSIRATWIIGESTTTFNFNYHIRVLGRYRHSQYNIPSESTCHGTPVSAYVTDGNCRFTSTTFRSGFISQVNLNGSGISIKHGNIRENTCRTYAVEIDNLIISTS